MRDALNVILAFIGTTSLTDTEYNLLYAELGDTYTDVEAYNALYAVLATRENISSTLTRLTYYYLAKGVAITEPSSDSNVFIGGVLA